MAENKAPARYLRLLENHPTAVKLNKLQALAEELKISLGFCNDRVFIHDDDRDSSLPDLFLEDLEDGNIDSFPFVFEYRLIYDNPKFFEFQKIQNEKLEKEHQEKDALKKEQERIKQQELLDRQRKEQESKEKALLAQLLEKYKT